MGSVIVERAAVLGPIGSGDDGAVFVFGSDGSVLSAFEYVPGSVNRLSLVPSVAGQAPGMVALGSDDDIDLGFAAKGTGSCRFGNGNGEILEVADNDNGLAFTDRVIVYPGDSSDNPAVRSTSSLSLGAAANSNVQFEVNGLIMAEVTNVAGVSVQPTMYPVLSGASDLARITIGGSAGVAHFYVQAKSSGVVYLANGAGTILRLESYGATSGAVNHVRVVNRATGNDPIVEALGDTNRSLLLKGAGTGGVKMGGSDGVAKIYANQTGISFFNGSAVAQQSVGPALSTGGSETNTNLATRINDIRTALINYGLVV